MGETVNMLLGKQLSIFGILLFGLTIISGSLVRKSRAPRPQWTTLVKTTSYTTISTTTVCYVSLNTALEACGKKRKRAIFDNPDTGEILELTPSKPSQDNLKDDFDEIDLDGTVDQLLQGEEVIDWYAHNSANFFQDERE